MTLVSRKRQQDIAQYPLLCPKKSKLSFTRKTLSVLFKLDTTLLMLPAFGLGFGAIVFSRIEKSKRPLSQLIGCLFRKTFGFACEAFSLPARIYAFAKSVFAQALNVVFFNKLGIAKRFSSNCIKQLTRIDAGSARSTQLIGISFYVPAKPIFREYGRAMKMMALHTNLYQ